MASVLLSAVGSLLGICILLAVAKDSRCVPAPVLSHMARLLSLSSFDIVGGLLYFLLVVRLRCCIAHCAVWLEMPVWTQR